MEEEQGPYHPLREQDGDAISADDTRLKQLGYKQELSRNLSYETFTLSIHEYLPLFFFFCLICGSTFDFSGTFPTSESHFSVLDECI